MSFLSGVIGVGSVDWSEEGDYKLQMKNAPSQLSLSDPENHPGKKYLMGLGVLEGLIEKAIFHLPF